MARRSLPVLWIWWIPLVWLVSSPWTGFTWTAQWHRVQYVPFVGPADKARDVALNVLLFVPFGLSAGWRRRPAQALTRATSLALAVSLSAEAMQLFSTRRFPSATDLLAGMVGSAIGATAGLLLHTPRLERRRGGAGW